MTNKKSRLLYFSGCEMNVSVNLSRPSAFFVESAELHRLFLMDALRVLVHPEKEDRVLENSRHFLP